LVKRGGKTPRSKRRDTDESKKKKQEAKSLHSGEEESKAIIRRERDLKNDGGATVGRTIGGHVKKKTEEVEHTTVGKTDQKKASTCGGGRGRVFLKTKPRFV